MNVMILHSFAAINVGNGIGPAPLAQGAFGGSAPPASNTVIQMLTLQGIGGTANP